MEHLIPSTAIDRYSAAPSPTTVAAVSSLHTNIRDVLGTDYETFLQGSYKNDTGVADLNDVDIVALRLQTVSGPFTGRLNPPFVSWSEIFQEVQNRLEESHHYRGKTETGDKCITVKTAFHADVVPAVKISDDGTDPIAIYSFREGKERKNYPRDHYQQNTTKHAQTAEAYKPTVRMFKRWVRNWFPNLDVAPSFYVECLIHNVPNAEFSSELATSFFFVGAHIVEHVSKQTVVLSVAGDKDILVESEWDWSRFEQFRNTLIPSLLLVSEALKATSVREAQRLWRAAFNE